MGFSLTSFSFYMLLTVICLVSQAALERYNKMKGNAPERLVSGSDDFTMLLWEPAISKHPKARLTGHQQVSAFLGCFMPFYASRFCPTLVFLEKESLLCCVNVLSFLIEIEKVCLDLLAETLYPFFVCERDLIPEL